MEEMRRRPTGAILTTRLRLDLLAVADAEEMAVVAGTVKIAV